MLANKSCSQFAELTIYGPTVAALLGVAGNAGALIGAGRIAALLVTSAGHTALIVVHATRRVRRLRHLPGGAVAAGTLRRQLAVVAAVESSAGDILFICNNFRQEGIKAFDLLCHAFYLPHCSSSLSQSQWPSQKRDSSRQAPLWHSASKARHLAATLSGPVVKGSPLIFRD